MYVLAKKLPGFNRLEQSMPDAMHTIAVQVKHLCRCLAGKAPEDSFVVRMQGKSLNRFQESWPTFTPVPMETKSTSGKSSNGKEREKGKKEKEK